MSNRFRCPMPGCEQWFDANQFPDQTAVTCPNCRTTFALRSPHVAAPAIAQEPLAFTSEPSLAARSAVRRSQSGVWNSYLVLVGGFFVLVSATVLGIYFANRDGSLAFQNGSNGRFVSSEFSFTFDYPPASWQRAPLLRKEVSANLMAYARLEANRATPTAWFAMAAKDFKDREPRESELRAGIRERLAFFRNLETEEVAGVRWAGKSAITYQFVGDIQGVFMSGQCSAIHADGIAYWMLLWAPGETINAQVQQDLVDMRDRFALVPRNWQPRRLNWQAFRPDGTSYQVTDGEERWAPLDLELTRPDPRVTLVLEATEPVKDGRSFLPRRAQLWLVELEVADNTGLEAGQAFLQSYLEKINQGTGATMTLSPLEGGEEMDILRLRADNSVARKQTTFFVLRALPPGEQHVLAIAQCPWDQRAEWETALLEITGSLERTAAE